MARISLRFGVAALVGGLMVLALRWFGRDTQPGLNDFDPVAAAVMFGSIGISAAAVFAIAVAAILATIVMLSGRFEGPAIAGFLLAFAGFVAMAAGRGFIP